MRQSPLWREFVANAAKQTMSAAQIADSTSLATEAAKALQREEAPAFVDSAVPHALEELASALPVTLEPDAVEGGKELLAADLVESVNNTLKPIAEVALASAGDYAEGFGKGFKKAAKKQGPIDGAKAFKWLRRLAVGGGAGAGSFVALSNLIARFPEAFAWLERVLQVLK
jgi:thiamine monophosphate synthase